MRSEAAETERTAAPVGLSTGTVRHTERRFTIRPSVPADQDEVADLIRIRAGWLRERSLNHSPWEANADALAAQCGDPDRAVWVLMEGDRIVGRTAWNTNSPESLFTADERRLPALFMHGTVGHPDVRGAGMLMLFWAVDHAHRHGYQWVRRGAAEPGLRRYYCEVQGWRILRPVPRQTTTVWAMSRLAEPQPGIEEYVVEQATIARQRGRAC